MLDSEPQETKWWLEGEERKAAIEQVTHLAFADESHWSEGRYRSIGLITFEKEYLVGIEEKLAETLKKNQGVKCLKFDDIKKRSRSKAEASKEFINVLIEAMLRKQVRADILIWDIEDARHNIPNRDDVKNLQLMYGRLFQHVILERWPVSKSQWALFPDKQRNVSWDNDVWNRLYNKKRQLMRIQKTTRPSFSEDFASGVDDVYFRYIEELCDELTTLLQAADLFAGLAAFSYNYPEARFPAKQKDMFSPSPPPLPKASLRLKVGVLEHLVELSKSKHLGVTDKKGLKTPNPKMPLNFWLYCPQHPKDKAPKKKLTPDCRHRHGD